MIARSLDRHVTAVEVAKGFLDIPEVFEHLPGFGSSFVKLLGEVGIQRAQEFGVIQFICVQDELADLREKFLRAAF